MHEMGHTYTSRTSRIFAAYWDWMGTSPLLGRSRDEEREFDIGESSGSWLAVSSSLTSSSVRCCLVAGWSVPSESEVRLRFLEAAGLE